MPEAIVALGEGKRIVGRLRFASDGRRQHSQFEYDAAWLAAEDRFALAPGLPLREGSHFSSGKDDKRSALPGCFADAAPDSWGRALMTKALGGGLSEFDYLVLSDDRTRQGALRFLGEDMEPLSDLTPPIPRLVELERLRTLAQRFERDPGGAEEEARDLAGVAGSLGGARPKANVEGDGHLWIAKFTSAQDTKPVERAEVATLKLARMCGLRVADARLELRDSDSPIALIRRFDRRGDTRIPYISARTALDWQSEDGGFYTDNRGRSSASCRRRMHCPRITPPGASPVPWHCSLWKRVQTRITGMDGSFRSSRGSQHIVRMTMHSSEHRR